MSRRRRSGWLTLTPELVLGGGAITMVLLSYVLVRRSVPEAFLLVIFPLAGWLVTTSSGGLILGLVMVLVLPSWLALGTAQTDVMRIASLSAAATVVFATGARRVRLADCALAMWVGATLLGWLLQYHQPFAGRVISGELTPLGFYLGARAVSRKDLHRVMLVIVFAGTLGAATVLYEYAQGHAVFIDASLYKWNASAGAIFRPGGVFGSPPAASTVLSIVTLFGLGCLRAVKGRIRVVTIGCIVICCVALVTTFTRTGLIALGVGVVLFLWLVRSPLLRPSWLIGFAAIAGAFVLLALPSLERTSIYQEGVTRSGNLASREGYWQLALPIATASAHSFIFGIGSGALEAPLVSTHAPTSLDVALTPQVFQNSLHSQYVTTLVELGVIGLATVVLFLLAVIVPAVRFARTARDPPMAAIAASMVAAAIFMAVDTVWLDRASFAMILVAAGLAALGDPRVTASSGD